MKKTICLVTNWFPTKDNPFQGVFFKEQALAVEDAFNFVVLRPVERGVKYARIPYSLRMVGRERNITEYELVINESLYRRFKDYAYDFKAKHVEHQSIEGVGRYISPSKNERLKAILTKVLTEDIKEDIDAFYCVDAQREAHALSILSEISGKPYIVGEHAPVPWPGTLINDANKFAIEKADAFLAISYDKVRQLMLQNIKLPKTVYIGNMIDESRLVIDRHTDESVRTFIAVAANSFYKNYDMLFNVIERLTQITDKDFRLIIAGYGANKGYSKDVDSFEERIRNSGFAGHAELIREIPHDEIGGVLNRADAFLMTSIQEGQPVSALEAACCGLPIFSTRCGGVEDYLDDSMGRLYNVNDVESMAQGLKDYLEGRLSFDSSHIRDSVVRRYGRDAFCNKFKETFNEIISKGEIK